jgi:lipopolysaccharide/colanic/teichoic acid biosynthesis glycosyltransferase
LRGASGITGSTQINGGNLPRKKKGALDDWYIRHASLWLMRALRS